MKQIIMVLFSTTILFSITIKTKLFVSSNDASSTKHFVLIHGSCHGAWSWYKIVALLRSYGGHDQINVTAIDLTAAGIDPTSVDDLRSVSEYHRPLIEFMEGLPPKKKVILVGHSLGGLALCQAMELFPHRISVAVFVTALMPGPSLNISTLNQESFKRTGSLMDSIYTYGNGPDNPPTTLILGPLFLKTKVYQLSPIEDLTLAYMLVRPLRLFTEEDLSKEIALTREKFGSVHRVFIITEKDELQKKDFQEWMIERNPPNEVLEIENSDHMIMMSRVRELCAHLLRIACKHRGY